MPAPLIGIVAHPALVDEAGTESWHRVTNVAYVKAVRKAGGVPVLLPLVEPDDAGPLLDAVDGLVLTGGADVDPATYGEAVHPETGVVDPERDAFDLALCRGAVDRDPPTLAVCRGSQVLNVALGGSLVQHLDFHLDLDRPNEAVHPVAVEPGSALAEWLGATAIDTNTLHHQAVKAVGPGLRAVAHAEDGTVEGVEVDGSRRVVGVQWHPELLRHRPEHLALFESLVRLAAG